MKIGGRHTNNLRCADDTISLAESSSDLKPLLMKVKEESARAGLHLNNKQTKIMIAEEIYNFKLDNEDILQLLKILLT